MDIRKLQRAIVDGLEDVKAQEIAVFNTEHLSPLFERVIIASGTSNRQTKALAASVRDAVRGNGFPVMRTEGEDNGEWIIVDCGAAVAHIMQPAIREYYHLEEIWGDKPVNMKLATGGAKLVKAAEPEGPVGKAAAKKAAAKKAAAKTTAAKTTAPRAPAKAPPRKPVAAKPTAAKVVARKAPAKKAPTGKVVTRVVGVKSSVAKRAPVKAAPAKRPAAKKAPARKTTSRA